MWWYLIPLILSLWRLRPMNKYIEVIPGYMVNICLKNSKKIEQTEENMKEEG